MKKLLVMIGMVVMVSANAQTTQTKKYVHPSESEITTNRACFEDLEVQGCRSQEEDPQQFRECLANAVDTLEDNCKSLVLKLYGE